MAFAALESKHNDFCCPVLAGKGSIASISSSQYANCAYSCKANISAKQLSAKGQFISCSPAVPKHFL